jgi:hypothetical protein
MEAAENDMTDRRTPRSSFVLIPILEDCPWITRPPVPWVHEGRGQTMTFLCASPGEPATFWEIPGWEMGTS